MKTDAMKKMGAVASSVALVGTAAVTVAGAVQPAFADGADAVGVASEASAPASAEQATVASDTVQKRAVEGTFSYDQGVVTPNAAIGSVFAKAASAMCTSMPQYALSCACGAPLMVIGPDGTAVQATVEDLASADEGKSFVMGCACSSNVAGGGAIANAEVSGASIASVLAMTMN